MFPEILFQIHSTNKRKKNWPKNWTTVFLGNIFHECSESLYATIPGGEITKAAIDTILANGSLIEEHIRRSYLKSIRPENFQADR